MIAQSIDHLMEHYMINAKETIYDTITNEIIRARNFVNNLDRLGMRLPSAQLYLRDGVC
jgi:phage-related holin